MTINGFWQVIDACASESTRDAQLAMLKDIIRSLPLEDCQDFSDHFCTESFKLTQNDVVVNAAYLAFEQSLSPDMLDYFSWWLVSLGKQACAHVIENPDMILDLLKTHIDPNYEEFGAVMNCRTKELPPIKRAFPAQKNQRPLVVRQDPASPHARAVCMVKVLEHAKCAFCIVKIQPRMCRPPSKRGMQRTIHVLPHIDHRRAPHDVLPDTIVSSRSIE